MIKATDILSNPKITAQLQQYYYKSKQKQLKLAAINTQSIFSLTNKVYHITLPLSLHLLVKIYENSLKQFTDNQLQTQIIIQLSQQHKYPSIIYYSHQFRIEQFLYEQEGVDGGVNDRMEKLVELVNILADYSLEYYTFVSKYNEKNHVKSKFYLDNLLLLYHHILQQKKAECPSLVLQCQQQLASVLQNQQIITTLSNILEDVSMVLSHNDCHLGNVISHKGFLYLLDFEFTNLNYVGFDIGNLINQWATQYGATFSINPQLQIGKEQLEKIVRIYFEKLSKVYNIEGDVSRWMFYTQLGRVLSHLFWMIVGLKQLNDQRIQFSMVEYIKIRKQQFHFHFKRLLNFNLNKEP